MCFCLFQNHCFAKWSAADPRCDNEGCWELSLLSKKHGQSSPEREAELSIIPGLCCVRMNGDHYQMHFWNKGSRSLPLNRLCSSPASGPRPLMKPHIIAGPQNISVGLRQSVVLECFAEGNPRPLVSWSRADSKPIDVMCPGPECWETGT